MPTDEPSWHTFGSAPVTSASGGVELDDSPPVSEIVTLARSNLTRGFTQKECAFYLGFGTCPVESIASPFDA